MPVDLDLEEQKIADIEKAIHDRAEELLKKGGISPKNAHAQAKQEIVDQNEDAINDSIAILKGELANVAGWDPELDHHQIEAENARKERIQDILDEIERVTGMA